MLKKCGHMLLFTHRVGFSFEKDYVCLCLKAGIIVQSVLNVLYITLSSPIKYRKHCYIERCCTGRGSIFISTAKITVKQTH